MASRRTQRKREHSLDTAVKPRKLPPRPPSICRACWKGPFAAQLGLLGQPIKREDGDIGTYLGDLDALGGYSYSVRWAVLESRAKGGCQWCQLLSTHVQSEFPELTSDTQLRIVVGMESLDDLPIEYTPDAAQILSIYVNAIELLTGPVYADADDPAAAHIVLRSPVLDVGSPRVLALARACVEECLIQHESCREFSDPNTSLPTRVLDCTDPGHPRLLITKGRRGTYVALSYVWGEDQPHRTTLANISSYTNSIDLATLPQTIRDAIHVTHALGISFLWIDSLCIIQDSDADKQQEITQMRRIYRDAHLTVVAASARKVSEGFLQDRPANPDICHDAFPQITFPFICPPRPSAPGELPDSEATTWEVGTVHVAPQFQTLQIRPLYDRAREPISARGWCMQEYFVSPRSLIFASHTLLVRCQTTTRCVGGAFHSLSGDARLPPVLFRAEPVARGTEGWLPVRQAWLDVVRDYTGRAISVPADKLVAFGAVAGMFERVLRTEYLAGLWRDTLLLDLLWSKGGSRSVQHPRPAAYRAPSWSWASVDGEVVVNGAPYAAREDAVAEVVECRVVLEDDRLPFERVVGGFLVLHAPFLQCVLYAIDDLEQDAINYRVLLQSLRGGGSEEPVGEEGGPLVLVDTGSLIFAYIDSADDAKRAMDGSTTMWAVPLFQQEKRLEGLIIVPANLATAPTRSMLEASPYADTTDIYSRLGFFGFDHDADLHTLGWDNLPLAEFVLV
ncbi:heterokaryon incompatibility protein-domain-containing protein [Lenzites betulinus]|nr:heterokaryon incompatibility protein-domain-containing protein [Lenzites betulinus]